MFDTVLKDNFDCDTPIFTNEILELFPQYTRAYIFRMIKSAEEDGFLSRLDTGVYYIPRKTPFGVSVITATDVARKRYIRCDGVTFGIYSGLTLQNAFSVTAQVPNTTEIVTNRESTRGRKVTIAGMPFVLKKSRTEITNENVDAYRVLQLFTESNGLEIGDAARQTVSRFMQEKEIDRNQLLELARVFPEKTLNRMVYNGVI